MLPGHDVATLGASPTGLRNRLRLAVLAVVRATARPTRPLLITLDDFDAADGESMQVVHDVITGDADGLLVIAAAKSGALVGQPRVRRPDRGAAATARSSTGTRSSDSSVPRSAPMPMKRVS